MDGRVTETTKPPHRLRIASPTTALAVGVLTLLLMALDIPLEAQIHTLSASNAWELEFVLPFTLVGSVVARREPRNPMGWLLLAIPLLTVLQGVAADYTVFVYHFGHRGWPLGPLALLFDVPGGAAGLVLVPLVILLFPDGRAGTRWRWPLRGAMVLYAGFVASRASVAAVALARQIPVWGGGGVIGENHPTGFAAWTNLTRPVIVPLFLLFTGLAGSAPTVVWLFLILGWAAVPLAIGVGILRYRLYEIDRLVSRTLAYAILTGLLGGTFIGLVALSTDTLALSGGVGVG